jgi:2-dehydro-3-deoxygluconokinase
MGICMKKVVGFGDFMLRLNPPGYLRFIQATQFEANYTGAEANVCVSLSRMGVKTEFVTRVPDNALAEAGISVLRKFNVGTNHIAIGGERMGIMYAEKGASQRPSRVVYDRKHTGFSTSDAKDYDWDVIMEGAGYFHFTGITPALGSEIVEICKQACVTAKKKGLIVFCDLNYRKNLWTTVQARKTMEELLPYVDVLISNEEDADKVLDIKAENSDVTAGILNKNGYVSVATQIKDKYGIDTVAITLRKSISASDNDWSAMLFAGNRAYFSREYRIHIVDRVGGGDSFAAGLIYGLGQGYSPQETVEYAAAASCLKQTMEWDFNLSTPSEILALVQGDGSGRVQR